MNSERDDEAIAGAWREHNGKTRTATSLVARDILRKACPGYHITRTDAYSCDLFGFAQAGHATVTLDEDAEYELVRHYHSPVDRLSKEPGVLGNDVEWGCYNYSWQGKQFLLFKFSYKETRSPVALLYILSPRADGAPLESTHPDTDSLLFAVGEWTKEVHNEVYVFDNSTWSKDKALWESVQGTSWDDVILDPNTRAKLVQDVQSFFDNRSVYESLNVPWKRGLIFHGLPGNGKTLSIKAMINSLATRPEPVPSLYVKSLDSCSGAKWSIHAIFSMARKKAPCLLIFEDLDSVVEDKTRSYFLNEVDGLESNEGILMIGSTNHLERLDIAITKRPSRFDRKYHFKLPSEAHRAAYGRYWARKLAKQGMVDAPESICPLVAKMTDGFSFAYLKELWLTSLLVLASGTYEDDDEDTDSISDAIVVDNHPAEPESEMAAEPTPGEDEATAQKDAGVLPPVDIPEELRDNLLLKVIRSQAKLLLEEMDNSQVEDAKKAAAKRQRSLQYVQARPIIPTNLRRDAV